GDGWRDEVLADLGLVQVLLAHWGVARREEAPAVSSLGPPLGGTLQGSGRRKPRTEPLPAFCCFFRRAIVLRVSSSPSVRGEDTDAPASRQFRFSPLGRVSRLFLEGCFLVSTPKAASRAEATNGRLYRAPPRPSQALDHHDALTLHPRHARIPRGWERAETAASLLGRHPMWRQPMKRSGKRGPGANNGS